MSTTKVQHHQHPSSLPIMSSKRKPVPLIFVTVVAFVIALLVLPSHRRLTQIMIAGGGGAYDITQPWTTISEKADDNTIRMHVDYHTNRFDYTSSWCPNANCTGTPICYPCQRRWLIILATGRSASTTTKEMIGRLPGVRMAGENNNLAGRFLELKEMPEHMTLAVSPAWHHNPILEESWSCAAQSIFTTVNPPKLGNGELLESDEKTILGFKEFRLFQNYSTNLTQMQIQEIALTQMQIQEIAKDMVDKFTHLFPCSRFVVNFRSNVTSQLASQVARLHYENETMALQMIQRDNDILHSFHKSMGPERSFLLDSTEWTKNISAFNQMVDWLGFSNCHFEAALEYNTKWGYTATKTEANLSQDCKYLYY